MLLCCSVRGWGECLCGRVYKCVCVLHGVAVSVEDVVLCGDLCYVLFYVSSALCYVWDCAGLSEVRCVVSHVL